MFNDAPFQNGNPVYFEKHAVAGNSTRFCRSSSNPLSDNILPRLHFSGLLWHSFGPQRYAVRQKMIPSVTSDRYDLTAFVRQ